jgi:uncharacterized protein (TIGR03000 family)
MMRATFLCFALAAAMALTVSDTANAQFRGGGGGFRVGGFNVGPVQVPSVSSSYGGWGFPGSSYYGPYWGGGYWGNPYYGSPFYYSQPTYDVRPAAYTTPSEARPVNMTVIVPKADAEVFLNDTATTSKGTERAFQSPALDPRVDYKYTVRAQWTENGKKVEQKREVPVKAGQSVTVDFREPAREIVAPPAIK